MRALRTIAAGLCLLAATVLAPASPAAAVNPGAPGLIAFIRGGNLFVAEPSGAVWQATTGGGYLWPRWQPGTGGGLAVLRHGDLYYGHYSATTHTFTADQRITTTGHVGAGAWSPDGTKLAYAYGLSVYAPTIHIADFAAPGAAATRAVVSRVETRLSAAARRLAQGLPAKQPRAAAAATGWDVLHDSLAIAWSPNGRWIAYPNGECWAIFDDCLSVLEVGTGEEWWVAAFGGGGATLDGFATVPAFTADSSRVLWTQQTRPRFEPDPQVGPLQVMSAPATGTGPATQVGVNWEHSAVPSPAGDGRVLVTAGRNGKAWVTLRNGATRTFLHQGYEHDWQGV
ncbi:hypothetical protein [Catellatospora sp. NPDC049609]|uniref:hypothetical protein n=1 Tax=Catellatospora sp. NPDC049609 TaxID=3155505 RepID=UPI0034249397